MFSLRFVGFTVAACATIACSISLGRSLAATPQHEVKPLDAGALLALVAVAGASTLCAGAAITDPRA